MIGLKFRAFFKNFITSMLKNLISQREYLETDPGFFVTINSYVKVFIIVCLGN